MSVTPPHAEALLEAMRGFQAACVLGAAAELDLFGPLAESPRTARATARACGTDERATTIVLDALAALGLVDKRDDHYGLPASLGPLLTETGAANLLPALRHLANCQRRWSRLATVLQTGRPPDVGPSTRGIDGDRDSFIGAMRCFTDPVVDLLVGCCPLSAGTHLLDVGGGSGNWTAGFLRAYPGTRATLFDRPEVIPLARAYLGDQGLADRVTLAEGDYLHDALPGGVQTAWLSAVAHQQSRAENRRLFTALHRALDPGGVLWIRDIVLDETRTAPPAGPLFAVNMLVATTGGNSYSLADYRADLAAAGFVSITHHRADPGMNALVRAVRP